MKNNNLELGRYSDEELLELADGDGQGGGSWTILISIASFISYETCPTTSCSDAC